MRRADGSCLRRPFPRGLTQAESLSYYVENPARLQACCPDKYEFIRDRIMSGYRYVSRLREDLTFEVLNLAPDFVYPGRIVRVDIAVEGAPEEDKRVHVEIALHTADGVFDGAQHAFFRLFSEDDTYTDVYLYPKDGNTSVLANTFTLSRFATSGARAAAEARTNKQRIDAAVMLCDKVRRPFNRPPGSCGVRQAVGQQSGSLHKLLWCQTSPMHPVAVRNSRMQRRSW